MLKINMRPAGLLLISSFNIYKQSKDVLHKIKVNILRILETETKDGAMTVHHSHQTYVNI